MASSHSSTGSTATHSGNPFAPLSPGAPPPAATIALLNIHGHVPVTLDMNAANFRQWRTFFDLTFKKFALMSHIDGTLDAILVRHDPQWLQIDACIVSWLYSTVAKSIMDHVYKPQTTTYDVWSSINNLFLDNSLHRAVLAQQEFHNLYQGDMSIAEYCSQVKQLADTLYDVGAAVTDPALVVNTLHGLNPKFGQAIAVLGAQKPPPTFIETCSYLRKEETHIAHSLKMEAQTALMAAGSNSSVPKPPSPTPSSPPSNGGGARRKKRKAGDKNRASGSTSTPTSRSPAPGTPFAPQWASAYNPWTGVVQAWPINSWRPGVLGVCPGAAPPQALTAFAAPPSLPDATSPSVPPVLFSALHGMPTNQPHGGEWFLDTGATSHMASSSGSAHQDGFAPM
ncbi:uncharacterized protein LOC120654143 [Panicum virgatum]|uniref:uncharacterized protein LOC120654143 n=1 Tax=Panicum virgatum TaxID=38727 RepID=UPI0019D618FA|nr:uncharacterized protein LOC120654143 [Panicum virgatum]